MLGVQAEQVNEERGGMWRRENRLPPKGAVDGRGETSRGLGVAGPDAGGPYWPFHAKEATQSSRASVEGAQIRTLQFEAHISDPSRRIRLWCLDSRAHSRKQLDCDFQPICSIRRRTQSWEPSQGSVDTILGTEKNRRVQARPSITWKRLTIKKKTGAPGPWCKGSPLAGTLGPSGEVRASGLSSGSYPV